MFHIIGLTMMLVALVAAVGGAGFVVIRGVRLARAGKRLRSHPIFDAEWRARQQDKTRRLSVGVAKLKEDLGSMATALARLALAIDELGALAYGSSRPIERVLRIGLPWLSGLLRTPEGR
jgi:hypothetical protein